MKDECNTNIDNVQIQDIVTTDEGKENVGNLNYVKVNNSNKTVSSSSSSNDNVIIHSDYSDDKIDDDILQSYKPILTFIRSFDRYLNGGMPRGYGFTEIYGDSGSGKTQFATQLCVMTTIPESVGGVELSSLFIDTNNSFSYDRCVQMAVGLAERLQILEQPKSVTEILNGQ